MIDTQAGPRRAWALPLFAVAVGALIGSRQLSDNSFLTHLATGRLILEDGFPHHDPYTFTAAGEPWVVQSWFASVLYGVAEDIGDLGAIRALTAVLAGAVGLVCWRLTAPAKAPVARLLVWVPAAVVGTHFWVERPLLIGLLLLALTLLAAERGLDRRWLLLVGWVWVNTHGSWPLGLVALGALAVGKRLDRMPTDGELTALRWLGGGLVLGALNPYGPRLLVFPVELLSKRESLQLVAEWQAPTFTSPGELAFLAAVALAVVGLRRRPSWTATVPLVGFTALALIGARNIPVAAIVLLSGTARSLEDLGGMARELVGRQARLVGVAGVGLATVALIGIATTDDFVASGYPVEATDFLVEEGLVPGGGRVIADDITGNYFEARFGADAGSFVDDRIEVVPAEVIDDYRVLLRGERGWQDVLERHDAEIVLWAADRPLAELLRLSGGWDLVHEDDDFVVFVARR